MIVKIEGCEIIERNIREWNIPQPEKDYMVVVQCSSYNHEKYIEDALKGFVMQRTNFSWCVLMTDDCSTDATAAIIRNYSEKYPEIIKSICLGYNHMQHLISRDPYILPWHNKAKYLAICEGDDYWTDPLKLQKQVDYLESHDECSICYTRASIFRQNENVMVDDFIGGFEPADTDLEYLLKNGNYIQTASVVYRYNKEIQAIIKKLGRLGFGDYITSILYAKQGYLHRIDDVTCVYRYGVGVWLASGVLNHHLNHIIAFSKLLPLFHEDKYRNIIEENIEIYKKKVQELQKSKEQELHKTVNSIRYRLGKYLLSPFAVLKRFVKF